MAGSAGAAALSALLLILCLAQDALAGCPPGNLLSGRRPHQARGIDAVDRLTDGLLAPEGDPASAPEAAQLNGLRPYVMWDLGEPFSIVAAAVQSDNNDAYRLSISVDAERFEPLWTVPKVDDSGLRERSSKDLTGVGRFLRFEALSGDQVYAATEVRVYCKPPEPWPPLRIVRYSSQPDAIGIRLAQMQSLKAVLGVLALGLLAWGLRRLRAGRPRRTVLGILIVLGALSWVHFGYFHGKSVVHFWDSFHYFMGTKYFPELGYFELYRCGARAEREIGRGDELDRLGIRDLDDNRVYPGTWTRTHEGRCRAQFAPARWDSFKADIEASRKLFVDRPVANSFSDHGFNATPVNVAWLRLWTSSVPASVENLSWLAQLDTVALLLSLGFIYWGFGLYACALAALVIGLGAPWNYHWIGGGIGRHTWFLCACAGLALLRRQRPFWGMFALTAAALLRLFPVIFLGAAGIKLVATWRKERRLTPAVRRGFAGVLVAAAVGVSAGGLANGFSSYGDFVRVVERHASTPLANHMGLDTLLTYRVGRGLDELQDPRLTDPVEPWRAARLQSRREQRPLWTLAVVASLGLIIWCAHKRLPLEECAALGGALVFSTLPMTSYDYIWVALLVPLCLPKRRRGVWLVGFALFTQFVWLGVPDIELRHVLYSAACFALLAALGYDVIRQTLSEREPHGPAIPKS